MNHIKSTSPAGNIPLPKAILRQWEEAHNDGLPKSWSFVSGMLVGLLIHQPDSDDLAFLHLVARQRRIMAENEVAEIKAQPEKTLAQAISGVSIAISDLTSQLQELQATLASFASREVKS